MGLCQVRHNRGGQAQEICSDFPAPLGTLVPCHTNCKELIAYAALLAEQKDAASCHPSQHCPCLSLALLPFLPRSQDWPFHSGSSCKPPRLWAQGSAAQHGLAQLGLERGYGRTVWQKSSLEGLPGSGWALGMELSSTVSHFWANVVQGRDLCAAKARAWVLLQRSLCHRRAAPGHGTQPELVFYLAGE